VRKALFLITSSCLILFSCSNITLEQITKEEILESFRSSSEYRVYKRSDKLFAQVITTFIIEPLGVEISTMNAGETRAFQQYAKTRLRLRIKQ
jgi:hypothetical protein